MFPSSLTLLHSGAIPDCAVRLERVFEFFTLQLMTQGAVELAYDGKMITLRGSWFWLAGGGAHIRFQPTPDACSWNHRYVVFCGPLANSWQAEGLLPNRAQPIPADKDYIAVFDEFLAQARRADAWGQARAKNLLEQLVFALADARVCEPAADAWLHRALDHLEVTGEFAPDYARMAAELGMSLSALREQFREVTGKPLHTYVLEGRMARARALLGDTDLPLKEVAASLGYGDVYYFHRQFQRMVGVTPTVYRKSGQR